MAESDKISLREELEENIDVFSEELERALQINDFVWVENTKPKMQEKDDRNDKKQLEFFNTSITSVAPYESFRETSGDTVLSQIKYSIQKKVDGEVVVTSDLDRELLVEQQYWEQNDCAAKKVNNMKSKYVTSQRMTIKEHNIIDKAKITPRQPSFYQFGIATTDILEMHVKKGYVGQYYNMAGRGLNSFVIYSSQPSTRMKGVTKYAHGAAVKVYKLGHDVRKNSTLLKKVQREYDHLKMIPYCYSWFVPEVLVMCKNVIVMEFIGFDQETAPSINTLPLERSKEMYDSIVVLVKICYKLHVVHGRLSCKNIRLYWDRAYFLGWSHSVHTDHPQALTKLMRDCHFVTKFFERRGVPVKSTEELFKSITGVEELSRSLLDLIQDKELRQEQHLSNPNRTSDSHCRTHSNPRFKE